MSYITCNKYGAFCSVCGEQMTMEEDDWDTCDCCGGEELPDEDECADELEAALGSAK